MKKKEARRISFPRAQNKHFKGSFYRALIWTLTFLIIMCGHTEIFHYFEVLEAHLRLFPKGSLRPSWTFLSSCSCLAFTQRAVKGRVEGQKERLGQNIMAGSTLHIATTFRAGISTAGMASHPDFSAGGRK